MYLPLKFAVPVNESCIIFGHVQEVVKEVYPIQSIRNFIIVRKDMGQYSISVILENACRDPQIQYGACYGVCLNTFALILLT